MSGTRLISILLMLVLLCPMMLSCGEKPLSDIPTQTLLTETLALFDNDANVDIYHSDAGENDDTYFDPGLAGQIFLGEYGAVIAEDGVIAEYAHAIPSALFAFEIDIFKGADTAAADRIEALLGTRMEIKSSLRSQIEHYLSTDPDSANELKALDDMEVWRIGNYVLLLATHNNAQVKNTVSTLLGASADAVVTEAPTQTTAALTESTPVIELTDPVKQAAEDGFTMTVTSHSAPDRVVLGGTCAVGAKIHVEGGIKDYVFCTDYNSWLVEVEIKDKGESLLKIRQELDGTMSVPLTVEVPYDRSVDFSDHGIYAALMGDNFQGHFVQQLDDWMGTNLLGEDQQKKMARAIQDKVKFCANFDTKLIYMIVPNQCLIYPETMPDRYERSTADYTLLDQFTAAAKEAGAIVLDLYPVMEAHKNDEFKIYHKTDSHWTDYGAYWGCHTLISEIAKDYPDAAPMIIGEDVSFYTKSVEAGDMMTHFEIDNALISETATFAEWLVDFPNRPNIYVDNRCEIDNHLVAKNQVITNPNAKDKNLPSAMIIRDSFSFNAFAYLNQAFSKIHWNYTWDYQFKKVDIKKADVDYLIYLVSEKSLGNILY